MPNPIAHTHTARPANLLAIIAFSFRLQFKKSRSALVAREHTSPRAHPVLRL